MLSRITLMMGMAPATAASKRSWRCSSRASSNSASPRLARSCLLAVTTFLPLRMAASTKSNANVVPPMTSTTMSMVGSSTMSAKSAVNRSAGSVGRTLARLDLQDLGHLEVHAGALEDLIVLLLDEPVDAGPDGAEAQQPYAHDPIPALPRPRLRQLVPVQRMVLGHQIRVALPLDDHPGLALVHEHHRRARVAVVVGGHGEAVRAGGRHDQDVSRLGLGEHRVLDEDVAALAVLARHGDTGLGRLVGLVGEHALVVRVVEHGPDVVAHAPVDAHVGADARDLLDGAHGVGGDAGLADDGAARLDEHPRHGQAVRPPSPRARPRP